MEPREAAELIALMRGTWPKFAPDEVADRLWLEDLSELDAELAHSIWRKLRDTEEFAPSWALFRAAYYDRAQATSRFRAIEPPSTPRSGLSWSESQAKRAEIVAAQREARVQERIASRHERTETERSMPGVDPLAPMLTYAEVYEQADA